MALHGWYLLAVPVAAFLIGVGYLGLLAEEGFYRLDAMTRAIRRWATGAA